MKIGISALKFNLEDALNICKKNKKITHIEMGIDNLEDVEALKKYKDEINKLNLSISTIGFSSSTININFSAI